MHAISVPAKLFVATVVVASLGPLAPIRAAQAGTTPPGGSATFQCQGDNDPQPAATPVTFSLIGQPTSVPAGNALSLSGNLGITLPAIDAQEAQLLLAQNASIDATDFTLVVTIDGKTTILKPTSVVSTPTAVSTPFLLTADVSYPELNVPASASGAVTVAMPVARTDTTKVTGAPAKVTFTAHITQDSILVPGRNVACWSDKLGSQATVARIPITGTAPAASPSGSSAAPTAAAFSQDVGSAAAPGDGGGLSTDVAPATSPDAVGSTPPPPASPATSTPTTTTALADSPIPPQTVTGQTFVPGWILAVLIAIFPASAIAYAVVQRKRLRRLMTPSTR